MIMLTSPLIWMLWLLILGVRKQKESYESI